MKTNEWTNGSGWRRWSQVLLVGLAMVLCSAFGECDKPDPEETVDPIETPEETIPVVIEDGEPVDPPEDAIAVLPADGDVLCVHPRYVDLALERLRAEPLGDGVYATWMEQADGEFAEARFEVFPTETPYACSDLHRRELDYPSPIVDLVAIMPEQDDVLCVHPRYVEEALRALQAEPIGDGRFVMASPAEDGLYWEELVFELHETLAPINCADNAEEVGDVTPAGTPTGAEDAVWSKGRYKVHAGAACNLPQAALTSSCRPADPGDPGNGRSWRTVLDGHTRCGKGSGLCVEVNAVIGRTQYFLGADCTGGQVASVPVKADACFASTPDAGGGAAGDPEVEDDRYRVYKDAACVLHAAAFDSRCEQSGSTHGSYAQRSWNDWHRCRKGTGYCAEGRAVVGLQGYFDDDGCSVRLHETSIIDFACQP